LATYHFCVNLSERLFKYEFRLGPAITKLMAFA